jgi:uracil phosphoribosyltransferase
MTSSVVVIEHPLIQHKLTLMRRAETSTAKFRELLTEISMLLAYEVTRDLPIKYELIKTPLAQMQAPVLASEKKLVIVAIMRAGQGILDGMLQLIPSA